MKIVFRYVIIFILTCLPGVIHSQDIDARSPKSAPSTKQQKIAEKKKVKRQKQEVKAIEKGKKQHLKLQSKNTKKMMRKSKHKSKRWNEDRKEFFLKRWFRKKHH
jgi:hypothetical protein